MGSGVDRASSFVTLPALAQFSRSALPNWRIMISFWPSATS